MSSRYRTDIQWFSRLCTLLPCLMTVKLLFQLLFCQLIILGFRRDVPIDPLISFRATCFLWETLIGHFIGYIFLVLGWIPVWFKTVLIFHSTYSMKHSSEILVIIDIIFGCTSMMQISCSLTKVLYCTEIWWLWSTYGYSEIIVMSGNQKVLLSVGNSHQKQRAQCSHKEIGMVSSNTQGRLWCLNDG